MRRVAMALAVWAGLAGWGCILAAQGSTPAAQQAAAATRPERTGIVTGRVMCADTQRPARLAQVKLVRVPTTADVKSGKNDRVSDGAPAGDAVETGLDGTYTVRNVKPGDYYVVVDKEGYLLPLGAFSLKELASTDDGVRARVAAAVHAIRVAADQTTQEDVVLERGATVSGTVLYDDGSPAASIEIKLLSKDVEGKWQPIKTARYRDNFGYVRTDDTGHFRVTGLPPGEYATEADLSITDHETTFGPMPNNPNGQIEIHTYKSRFSLPVYSGDVLHKPEAKSYTLGRGEVRAGADLVFPLAKLHRVGGQLLARDGHAVNGGRVELLFSDDKTKLTEAEVQFDDAAFHLEFIPEGDFLLKVSGAKDVSHVQVENAPGYTPRFHEESRTIKSYGDAERTLKVTGDAGDVMVLLPESKAAGSR